LEELWRDIEGFEGIYQVSNKGSVKSLDRIIVCKDGKEKRYRGKVLKASDNGSGYKYVSLGRGVGNRRYVHRLVANAFISNNEGLPEINHLDNDRGNNYSYNLEWCTHKDNINHKIIQGRQPVGSKHYRSKLNEDAVTEIIQLLVSGLSQTKIANKYGVNQVTISEINTGKTWRHVV
jgi:hypothetical protein